MPVNDLARSDVVTATEQTSVAELAQTMDDATVGSIVIVDGNKPVGIVTDRDLALRVVAEEADASTLTAGNVMSEDLKTIARSAGFYTAVEQMSSHAVRRLPVCDDAGELVGIITTDDLNELIADEQSELADVIRAQRPPY